MNKYHLMRFGGGGGGASNEDISQIAGNVLVEDVTRSLQGGWTR